MIDVSKIRVGDEGTIRVRTAKHTKLPWRADGPDYFGDYNILHDGDSLAVAAVISNMRSAETVAANAAFIVRAANCHDELVSALELLVADVADYETWQRHCHAVDVAKAALAKARGETP